VGAGDGEEEIDEAELAAESTGGLRLGEGTGDGSWAAEEARPDGLTGEPGGAEPVGGGATGHAAGST
jgi:hypothetical protein